MRLVGAVGIENNTGRNFKGLEEMRRSAKVLKRNNEERDGVLIGPSMTPRFHRTLRFRHYVSSHCSKGVVSFGPNFATRMAS